MLALFCLRLAVGLLFCLLLLSPAQINPRFYRTHFVVSLGLGALAALMLDSEAAPGVLWAALSAGMILALVGFLSWSLEGAPGGRLFIVAAAAAFVAAMILLDPGPHPPVPWGWRLASDLTSAAVLGAATTAMLMGHSYLIAPAMSISPLMRLLALLVLAALARMVLSSITLSLWSWTPGHSLVNLRDETVLWLPLRWGLGFLAPLVLAWMAYQAARIRSTQSATGILYVVVVFCFLGELTGQLLQANTGFAL